MDKSNWKKYIFYFPGGNWVTMEAPPKLLAEGLGNDSKWIYAFDEDGNLEEAVALQHVLSIEVEEELGGRDE